MLETVLMFLTAGVIGWFLIAPRLGIQPLGRYTAWFTGRSFPAPPAVDADLWRVPPFIVGEGPGPELLKLPDGRYQLIGHTSPFISGEDLATLYASARGGGKTNASRDLEERLEAGVPGGGTNAKSDTHLLSTIEQGKLTPAMYEILRARRAGYDRLYYGRWENYEENGDEGHDTPRALQEPRTGTIPPIVVDDMGTRLEYPFIEEPAPAPGPYTVPVIYSYDTGEWVPFDIRRGSWAVIGATGSGKGNFIMSLLLKLITLPLVDVVVVDAKAGLDYIDIAPVIKLFDGDNLTAGLIHANGLMSRNNNLLKKARCKNIESYNSGPGRGKPLKYTVVVIDEGAELSTKERGIAARIARMGRAAGILIIWATQYPTVEALPSQIAANLKNRICFQVASPRHVPVALAREQGDLSAPRPDLFPGPGICVYKVIGGRELVGRVPELTDKEQADILRALGLEEPATPISLQDGVSAPIAAANAPVAGKLAPDELAWLQAVDEGAGEPVRTCKRCGTTDNLRRTKTGDMCRGCWGNKGVTNG